jgi:hypothetical protein
MEDFLKLKIIWFNPWQILIELLEDVFLPDTIYYSEPCQHLHDVVIDATCWNNDVWSFPKVIN